MKAILLAWLFCMPWLWACIFLHELSHFVSGRLLGMQPYALVVGSGPTLFRRRVNGILVSLHLRPSHGLVFVPPRDPGQPVWRHLLFLSAGLISDSCMLLLLCLWIRYGGVASDLYAALIGLAVFHGFYIFTNLVPTDLKIGAKPLANDGKAIWLYLKGGSAYGAQRYRDLYVESVRRYDPAFEISSAWINAAPAHLIAQYHEGMRAIDTHDMQAAPAKLVPLLASGRFSPGEEAAILDGMACIALYEKHAAHMGQALDWVRRARSLVPECATLRGSQGALLVEQAGVVMQSGLPDAKVRAAASMREGLDLLTPLTEEGNTLIDRAISMHYIARAHEILGEKEEEAIWKRRGASLAQGRGATPLANQRVGRVGRAGAWFIAIVGGLASVFGLPLTLRETLNGQGSLAMLGLMLFVGYCALLTGYIGLHGRTPRSFLLWKK